MIIAYAIIGAATLVLGTHAVSVVTDQSLGYTVDVGSLPVNGLLLYFVASVAVDRATKKLPKWVGWAILMLVLGGLTMLFRYVGGYRTVLG